MSLDTILGDIEISAIKSYRIVANPVYSFLDYFHINLFNCRYTPSCSHYAEEAIKEQGVLKGTYLAAKRIIRCNPQGGFGHDPVPKKS